MQAEEGARGGAQSELSQAEAGETVTGTATRTPLRSRLIPQPSTPRTGLHMPLPTSKLPRSFFPFHLLPRFFFPVHLLP